jgi:Zn-dependent protease with chaperone function
MWFLSSYPGMYITQAVLHSLIANTLVEFSLFAWGIRDHRARFRYRLLTLALPVLLFPVFQAFNPDRGDIFFRYESALFNSHQWLSLSLFGIVPLYALFISSLVLVSVVFLCQEIVPILKSSSPETEIVSSGTDASLEEALDEACAGLAAEKPSVRVLDEDYPVLFTGGLRNHTLVISRFLLDRLSRPELISALLHELIHMKRGSSIKTQLIYILRMLMFFNLFSLIEFRRLVHDDEFICDSMTVAVTRDPMSLVRALEVFEDLPDTTFAGMQSRLETHSHNALLRERIQHLQNMEEAGLPAFSWTLYLITGYAIMHISYMVV